MKSVTKLDDLLLKYALYEVSGDYEKAQEVMSELKEYRKTENCKKDIMYLQNNNFFQLIDGKGRKIYLTDELKKLEGSER